MAFVDEARIFVQAGNGGKGCESFYRDKYMRHPIPDGGNGGNGGDVIFIADSRIRTLLDYRFKQHYQGERGGHASSKNQTGKTGADCLLRVPVGTIIRNHDTKLLIKDLVEHGQKIVVAKGGHGGRGNARNKIPTPPKPGEQITIHLELKMIADVGIVGFPNAGKSTLISNISRVKSKIGNYHFTTRAPILGVVEADDDFNFIVADLPGLIEGAHLGKGMGDRFLKHAERTKIILHLIDMAGSEARDPLEDYEKISEELRLYSGHLSIKEKIVVANKMDLPEAKENLKRFKRKYKEKIYEVSALEQKNLEKLVTALKKMLIKHRKSEDVAKVPQTS